MAGPCHQGALGAVWREVGEEEVDGTGEGREHLSPERRACQQVSFESHRALFPDLQGSFGVDT